jgi:hypothetical protein
MVYPHTTTVGANAEFSYRLNISGVETENDDAFGEARKHRG